MGDREGSGRPPRDSFIFERDRPLRSPRESVSWSMSDHQGIRNQNNMQQLSHAMQDMPPEIQNPQNLLRANTNQPRGRFLIDRAIGLGHIAAVTVRIIAVGVQLQIHA